VSENLYTNIDGQEDAVFAESVGNQLDRIAQELTTLIHMRRYYKPEYWLVHLTTESTVETYKSAVAQPPFKNT
jgi:hypothetical protein